MRVGRPEATRPELLPYSVDALAGEAAAEAVKRGSDPKQVGVLLLLPVMLLFHALAATVSVQSRHFKTSRLFLLYFLPVFLYLLLASHTYKSP